MEWHHWRRLRWKRAREKNWGRGADLQNGPKKRWRSGPEKENQLQVGLPRKEVALLRVLNLVGRRSEGQGRSECIALTIRKSWATFLKKHFPCSDECKRQIAVGWRTRRRYWSRDGQCRQFLKLSCEEERGTEGDVEAGRGFWFPDGKDLSFYKWGQEGVNKEGTVKNVGDRRNGCCAWESKDRPQISGGNWP